MTDTVLPYKAFPRDPHRPFRNGTASVGALQWAKMIFNWIFIAPLKVTASILVMLMGLLVMALATAGMSEADKQHPMPAWRNAIKALMHPLVRAYAWCLGFFWVPVEGSCAPADQAPIIVSNHISFTDPIMLMAHNMAAAMAAGEFKDIPGFGPLMAGAQCIFLDRHDPHSRSKAKAEIERRARQPGWPHLLIFPEATTTNQSCLLRFKRGAFDLGLPVQPVVVRQPWQHHDPCWVDEGPGTGGIWARMLGQFYMSMSVQYLPVCVPSPEEVADPDLFAERVRRVMAEALRVPLSALSQDDNAVTTHAARRGYPVDHVTVGLMQFRSLGVKPKAFRPLVDLFRTLDTARVGHLEPKQLAGLLRYPLSGAGLSRLAALHRHVLADSDGAFTFHGFILLWLALAARLPGGWHTLANMAVTLAGAQAGPGPSLDRLAECVASFAQDPSQARQRLLDSWAPALPAAAVPVEELAAWMEANSASVTQALQAALVPEHPAVDSNALWSGFLPAATTGRASAK